jgi:hypothetical protein
MVWCGPAAVSCRFVPPSRASVLCCRAFFLLHLPVFTPDFVSQITRPWEVCTTRHHTATARGPLRHQALGTSAVAAYKAFNGARAVAEYSAALPDRAILDARSLRGSGGYPQPPGTPHPFCINSTRA